MFQDWKKPSAKFLFALTLLTALFLTSCASTKNATIRSTTTSNLEHAADYGEETETSNTESLEAVGDRHEQTDTETTTELTSNEEVTTTVREYDTDKPTDPVTGTPPLKRETTQTRRKTDAGRQTQTTGQTIDEHREQPRSCQNGITDNQRGEYAYRHGHRNPRTAGVESPATSALHPRGDCRRCGGRVAGVET